MKDLGCQAAQGGGTDHAHKGAQKAVVSSNLAWPQPIVTTISSGDLPNLGQISPDALLRACCRQFDHSLGTLSHEVLHHGLQDLVLLLWCRHQSRATRLDSYG